MDNGFDRLRDNDPAGHLGPDVDALLRQTSAKVSPMNRIPASAPRRLRGTQLLAAAAALAVFASGGYLVGIRQPETSSLISATSDSTPASVSVGAMKGAGGPDMPAPERSSFMGWAGNTILRPSTSIPNVSGVGGAYGFSTDKLDRIAFAKSLAEALDLDASAVKANEGFIGFAGLSVDSTGPQATFWVNAANRNPWNCGISNDPADAPTTEDEMAAQNAECLKLWPKPSESDALKQAKSVLATLKLPALKTATYSVRWSDDRAVTVVAMPTIDGMELRGIETSVLVGAKGVFSLNGAAADVVRVNAYPIAGARDVALRTAMRKWSAFGPWNITSNASSAVAFDGGSVASQTSRKDGLLMPQGNVAEIDVNSAARGLQLQWFPGGESLFLPAWDYAATDGSVWQMLALAEEYIDWAPQTGAMPMAR